MGTYRPHTLVRGTSVWKSRKISRKKTIWAAAAIEEHYWALARYFLLFLFGVSFIRSSPSSLLRAAEEQQGKNSQCWILAQESSGTGGVCALTFHTSKHASPCFAPGVVFIFLLFEGGSPHFAISCTRDNNTSQGSPVLLCQKEKREFK